MAVPVITIEGRVIGEPKLKFNDAGNASMMFRMVASDRKRNEATGKWEDTENFWVTVRVFRDLAVHAMDTIRDRDEVIVVGKLVTKEWEDKGEKKSAPQLYAWSIGPSLQFGARPHSDAAGREQRPSAQVQRSGAQAGGPPEDQWSTPAPSNTPRVQRPAPTSNDPLAAWD
jgi:single-strand DNA-binding protein